MRDKLGYALRSPMHRIYKKKGKRTGASNCIIGTIVISTVCTSTWKISLAEDVGVSKQPEHHKNCKFMFLFTPGILPRYILALRLSN